MNRNIIDDLIELENSISKQQILYAEFLAYVWKNEKSRYYNERNKRYFEIFFMLSEGSFFLNDAKILLEWIEKENKGKLPVNIEIMFNEWLLEKKV